MDNTFLCQRSVKTAALGLTLASFFMLGQQDCDEPPQPTGGDELIDAYIEEQRLQQQIVGMALGVVVDGQVAYLSGYGYEDRERHIATSPQSTMFRWASISKTITGVAAMAVQQQYELDLDADIRSHYPAYDLPADYLLGEGTETDHLPEGSFISLRNLLGHLGGVQHYSNGMAKATPPVVQTNNPSSNTGFEWALERWEDAPLVEVPGSNYSYTTMGFNLAGAVVGARIGAATGSSLAPDQLFTEFVRENIAEASGATGLQPDYQWEPIDHRAKGYLVMGEGLVTQDIDSDISWKLPGGGYISTIEDIAKYCRALTDERILSDASKEEMWTKQVKTNGSTVNYGLGFSIGSRNGNSRVSHNGEQEKATSRLVLYPDDSLCIVIQTNTRGGTPDFDVSLTGVANGVEDIIRGRLAEGEAAIQVQ